MKVFCFLFCVALLVACSNPKYEELSNADGLFSSLQNNEFVMIELQTPRNGYHKKDLVFRKGSVVESRGGIPLSSEGLTALDLLVRSVNNRTPSGNYCTNFGSLTVTKNFADGTVHKYRGAFDWCNPEEQDILVRVLGNIDDYFDDIPKD